MRHVVLFIGFVAIAFAGIALHAELARWIQDIASPNRLDAVFFRAVSLPSGAIEVRRPPKETVSELAKLIATSPADADLYALRARENEQQLDFNAAESDWKKAAQLATSKFSATTDLADFYQRRIRPRDEIAALETAAKMPAAAFERWTPVSQQQSWKTFERILTVIRVQALPGEFTVNAYRSWMARHPNESSVPKLYLQYLTDRKQFDDAQKLIADYRTAFPNDTTYPIQATATLAWRRGSLDDALRIYDQSFRPLWPPDLVASYFNLLKEAHALRRYLEQARSQIAARPTDIAAAARVFYYYQQQGNLAASQRALLEYRLRKQSQNSVWSAEELLTLAKLFEGVNNPDEAARSYYGLYSLPGADSASQEKALAGIANLLLSAPEQSIHFGAGDLSLYRDIAQLDPGPGFLNGILSLLLNSADPGSRYATEDSASIAYFHRVKAAELVRLFDSRFPTSAERPRLHMLLISALATYGDSDGVIRGGSEFLTVFPRGEDRSQVALLMADAYARKNQAQQEFGIYDDLLKELAARADGVPIGEALAPPVAGTSQNAGNPPPRPVRSPEYASVLDRYISRLVALKRGRDALALYRREVDRNPNDPGLYERLAGFLEENKMGADVEQVYRRAMAQFSDRSWSHKLARWYLNQRQAAQFEQLTQDVVKIFSGTELESYVRDANNGQPLAPVLYRQVNLYAHQRFPHNLTFVRNLLTAYSQRGTADPVASEALLRKYWFHANDLRDRYFELLSRTKRLDAELAAVKGAAGANPATQQFLAEAVVWQAHFEDAAPLLQAVSADFPADMDRGSRAASLFRSLATYEAPGDIRNTRLAVAIQQNLTRAEPGNTAALTRLGEIYADRELFQRSKPAWDRIAQVRPGESNGYLESATVFWDYFRFDDALRLIDDGRKKLADPTLFAYEAGAIYENQRNYTRAVSEYAKGALASETSLARGRFIQLATRARDRDAIEAITAREVAGANPTTTAVSLRMAVLNAQNRRADVESLLTALADRTTSLELLAYLQQTAVRDGFDKVQEHSIRREIALLTDPVERTRERLALVRFYEGQRDIDAARTVTAALYRENPTTLGVVRSTVDFYWRNKDERTAIDVLTQAAGAAQPGYRKSFTFEAARKSTDAGEFQRARTLLAGLLKDEPFNAEYMAATADAFAREGNDSGLRDFYAAKLKDIASAQLTAPDRIEKTAGLRRGLIPVLTRLKDYTGAVDQYIEVINRFPEDETLVREASLYGAAHGRAQQLTAYYAKAQNDSSKDYRWPLVLARIDTALEDFPGAITEYTRAAEVRPGRIDLFTARASIEERLLRFDEAAGTYAKLYELNYHNSQWMEKIAEIRARQGRADETLTALRRALMEDRPQRPEVFFAMAEKLESWKMLAPARGYAEKGVAAAGDDLLTDFSSGAQLYARVMTQARAYDAAYKKLTSLIHDTPGRPASHPELDPMLRQIGVVVAEYFTPEEKQAFAVFLGANLPSVTAARIRSRMPMVESAGLADLEAKWRNQLLLSSPGQPPQQLVAIQQQRLRYDELGAQLEAYWKALPADSPNRDALLPQAAENYRLAGSTNSEARILAQLDQMGGLSGELLARYGANLARTPARFDAVVAAENRSEQTRNGLASYAVENGTAARSLEVIAARGRGLPPVWTRAYTGLVGLYFAHPAQPIAAAFQDALGVATIGERVGKPVDRSLQLAGDGWFYYGARYGEYLDLTKKPDAEDYLAATVEASPSHAGAYFNLAEYYRESGQTERAIVDYQNALQLDAKRGDAHDRMALIFWQQNKREDAVREFQAALEALLKQENDRRVPEDFWRSLAATLEDIGKCQVLSSVRPAADRVLRTYVRHNGSYESDLLMRAALRAAIDPAAGVAWIVDLSKAAPEQPEFLANIVKADWIPEEQRPLVYQALIQSSKQKLDNTFGEARAWAESQLQNRQFDWIEYLLDQKQLAAARSALAAMPDEARKARGQQVTTIEVRIAALDGGLKALLEKYSKEPVTPVAELQNAANHLQQHGDRAAARQILELVYTKQLDSHEFAVATFLGLAEIKLEQGDAKAAVALLRRMTLVAGAPFEGLSEAGGLLARTGHPVEALGFIAGRVQSTPWDIRAKVELGRVQVAAGQDREQGIQVLRTIAESGEAPYQSRVGAAEFLSESMAAPVATASAELNLLSGSAPITTIDAEKPYYYRARIAAAARSNDPAVKIRLLQGAVAIEPKIQEAKLLLFDAAFRAKRYQTAVSSLFSMLTRTGFSPAADLPPLGPGQILQGLPDAPYYADQFLGGAMEAAQRASIARNLAESYVRLNSLREAAMYYQIALRLQPADATSKMQLSLIQAQLERQGENRKRQPVITANLEQDHPVRPRIPAPAGAQGGGQ